jgi:hypothetical protein
VYRIFELLVGDDLRNLYRGACGAAQPQTERFEGQLHLNKLDSSGTQLHTWSQTVKEVEGNGAKGQYSLIYNSIFR